MLVSLPLSLPRSCAPSIPTWASAAILLAAGCAASPSDAPDPAKGDIVAPEPLGAHDVPITACDVTDEQIVCREVVGENAAKIWSVRVQLSQHHQIEPTIGEDGVREFDLAGSAWKPGTPVKIVAVGQFGVGELGVRGETGLLTPSAESAQYEILASGLQMWELGFLLAEPEANLVWLNISHPGLGLESSGVFEDFDESGIGYLTLPVQDRLEIAVNHAEPHDVEAPGYYVLSYDGGLRPATEDDWGF